MQKVKIFMGSATAEGLRELEATINEWVEKEKASITNISVTEREISPDEQQTLTGELTDQILVCLTYEVK